MLISAETYYPTYPLNQFIDCIWRGKGTDVNISSFHYAPLFTELIFTFDGDFIMNGQQIEIDSTPYYQYTISGLKTSPFQTVNLGNYINVGCILKPFCYGLLKKITKDDRDKLAELIYRTICEPKQPDFSKVALFLEHWFMAREIDPDLIKFEKYISKTLIKKGSLAHFNTQIDRSQKSFIHKFKEQYVLTPGKYLQLVQVNKAVELLKKRTNNSLTEIGLDAGFYDQAHFIRTFKRYSGFTPKTFTYPHVD